MSLWIQVGETGKPSCCKLVPWWGRLAGVCIYFFLSFLISLGSPNLICSFSPFFFIIISIMFVIKKNGGKEIEKKRN